MNTVAPALTVSDLDLVADAKLGDEAAFSELYTRHFDRIYALMRVALNEAEHAEEATQRVFMEVLRGISDYEPGEPPFADWVLAIARKEASASLRKRTSSSGAAPSPRRRSSPNGHADEELRALRFTTDEQLIVLIGCLPESQRQAMVLRHVLGFSEREVAEVLGKRPADVRRLQSSGMAFLRERLAAVGREPNGRTRLAMRRQVRRGPLRPAHGVTLLR